MRPRTSALKPCHSHPTRDRHGFTLLELVVVIVIIAALAGMIVSNVGGMTGDAEKVAAAATLQTVREALVGSAAGSGYLRDFRSVPGFAPANVRMHDLLAPESYSDFRTFDPLAVRGWRGPYLRNTHGVKNTNAARNGAFPAGDERRFAGDATFLERGFFNDTATSFYGSVGDRAVADPWGNPVVIQIPPGSALPLTATEWQRLDYARVVSAGPDGILSTPRDRLAGRVDSGSTAARGDDLVLFLNRPDIYEP